MVNENIMAIRQAYAEGFMSDEEYVKAIKKERETE